jgi:hypothetical protein
VRVGDLVLSRRRWVIPSSAFPQHAFVAQRAPHESVLQLDSWRRDVGLPQRAFYKTVSFPSRPEGSDPLDHMRAQFASTRARPTFVDFHSILHQRAFAKRLAKPDVQELIVEELLPDPSDSLFCSESGERLATELVIQLDRLALGTRA